MPVFQDPAGSQPQVVFGVGGLGGRLVRQSEGPGFAVLLTVKLHARARLHIGVEAFAETPFGFLAVDHRPAQAAGLVIVVKGRQVVTVSPAEGGIFLEQAFLNVEADVLSLVIIEFRVGLGYGKPVDIAIAVEDVKKRLALQFRFLRDQIGRPDFFHLEAFGKLDQLPQI